MPDDLDPNKFHVLNPIQKRNIAIILVVLLLVAVPLISTIYYNFAVTRPAQAAKGTTFEIKKGEGVLEIADNLYKRDLLNSKYLFALHACLSGKDKNIQAGIYEIPGGASVEELLDLFQHGTDDIKITFLEGWRVEEMALEASEKFENIDYEEFILLAQDYEGYLFPDTYMFNSDIKESEMIKELRKNFDNKTEKLLAEESLEYAGLTKEDTVIIASIVEREVSDPNDRRIVAGILTKRYKAGELVGADATTQYLAALLRSGCPLEQSSICPSVDLAADTKWWPKDLTVEELEYDSPYNTRRNAGLPPSPISSISIDTLDAVLNSEETVYWYYLTDANGITHYAQTIEEHHLNMQRYLN